MTYDVDNNEQQEQEQEDKLAQEAAELDGYFSDTPLDIQPNYPPLNDKFDTAIVITNLPQVSEVKLEKLQKVVIKLTSRIGTLKASSSSSSNDEETSSNKFDGIWMPFDNNSTTKATTLGFCFVEYETVEQAKNAVQVLQGYRFDKNHSLQVMPYPRAQKLQSFAQDDVQEGEGGKGGKGFQEPQPAPFVSSPNAMKWLEDPNQRDEFVVRFAKETVVNWWDAKTNDPVVDYDGAKQKDEGVCWCEYYCHWSPAGSYLATLVPARGVILWSGEHYEKSGRFVAPQVKHVVFSPCENYLLTNNERPDDPTAIKVYHIATGKLLRAFPLYPDGMEVAGGGEGQQQQPPPPSPPFLWSHDDQYLARLGNGLISIYETATGMRLLDKRSLAAPGVKEFQWSPQANILAYWAPEAKNSPAHVDLIEIPSRKQLRQKNLFNVTRCNMVWQDHGEYLAVKVTRHTKSKKTLYNNIELFRLNEQGVPVEMLDTKDAVMALAWEPYGSRFAMIHAENPSAAKVNVSFYDMMKQGEVVTVKKGGGAAAAKHHKGGVPQKQETVVAELNKIETLQGRQCNVLFWSPAGSTIIMASLGESASGTLEFYDVDNKTMVVKEHYRANQVLWDPAGRTAATIVSQPIEGGHFKFAMDNGYILWSFQGKQLYQQSFETFYQFEWRPRQSLLSKGEIEKVKKNLKKYEKQFDKADRKRQRAIYLEETKGKRAERTKYRELLARNKAIQAKHRTQHVSLAGGYDSDDESNYVTVDFVVETILSTKEEVVV